MPSEKHIIVKGKKYKKSPLKESPYKRKLVKGLMKARRDVKTALDKKNAKSERNARNRVQKYKVLLATTIPSGLISIGPYSGIKFH